MMKPKPAKKKSAAENCEADAAKKPRAASGIRKETAGFKNRAHAERRRAAKTAKADRGAARKQRNVPVIEGRTFKELFNSTLNAVLAVDAQNKMERSMRMLWHSDFYGLDENTGTMRADLKLPARLTVPDGFDGWKVWEAVAVSKIVALTRLELAQPLKKERKEGSKPHKLGVLSGGVWECLQEGIIQAAMVGAFDEDARPIFPFMSANGGTPSLDDVISFSRRIEARRENFKAGHAWPMQRRHFYIAYNWLRVESLCGEWPGLCAFDLPSVARIIAFHEDGKTEEAMEKSNLSTVISKIGLTRCKPASWVARENEDDEGNLSFHPRK